jgi:hypothetical protein
VVFAALGLFGVSASHREGQLVLSLGRGSEAVWDAEVDAMEEYLPVVREAFRDEIDSRIAVFLEALETDLIRMERSKERRRALLAHAADERWNTDLRRIAVIVDMVVRQHERFRDDVMTWRTSVDDALSELPGNPNTRKEES